MNYGEMVKMYHDRVNPMIELYRRAMHTEDLWLHVIKVFDEDYGVKGANIVKFTEEVNELIQAVVAVNDTISMETYEHLSEDKSWKETPTWFRLLEELADVHIMMDINMAEMRSIYGGSELDHEYKVSEQYWQEMVRRTNKSRDAIIEELTRVNITAVKLFFSTNGEELETGMDYATLNILFGEVYTLIRLILNRYGIDWGCFLTMRNVKIYRLMLKHEIIKE